MPIREKLDGNLVDAMETNDNDMGNSESTKEKPALMFKIACKSKLWGEFIALLSESPVWWYDTFYTLEIY